MVIYVQILSADNGIWMCRTHAALIDRDEKYFTVEMFKKWKEDVEREAGNRLIGQETIIRFYWSRGYGDII